jgi:DNA-directed RNA polymerase subunit beta'
MLKGKQGRFRQNLLGKRVDYSGRSVIVVGPDLRLHQCGLPKKMALELFKPFIYNRLEAKGLVTTIKGAKKLVEREAPEVWDTLSEVVREYPVLLNRAPTLHRLGIQSFEPLLVEGKAIQLHPLVCQAYNADFDGDQMAVHVPLSVEAQIEARVLMMSTNNILSPANGEPIIVPNQDIVLGLYYLTREKPLAKGEGKIFADITEVRMAYDAGEVDLQAAVEARIGGERYKTTVGRVLLFEEVPEGISFAEINRTLDKKALKNLVGHCYRNAGTKDTVILADRLKDIGYKYSTMSGLSICVNDMVVPRHKGSIIDQAMDEVRTIEKQYKDGIITDGEKYNKAIDIWAKATEDVAAEMMEEISQETLTAPDGREIVTSSFNPIFMMADSGARGSKDQMKQLAGMRGLMAKPSGEIIATPITANFREGLTVLQYFISTHGARKGLADTALKTANSGYLTRRLVDVSLDAIVMEKDCGTINGIEVEALREGGEVIQHVGERVLGRTALRDIYDPITGEVLIAADQEIDETSVSLLEEAGIEKVEIRSVLTCECRRGVCSKCYGRDLGNSKLVDVGEAIGTVAAQSIGEPGTQLTMRTFHIGGAAARRAEQSRVEARFNGHLKYINLVTVESTEGTKVVMNRNGEVAIVGEGGRERERYKVNYGAHLLVADNEAIAVGQVIAQWDPYTSPILTDVEGQVKFGDVIENITMQERKDPVTGLSTKVTVEAKKADLRPRISIKDLTSGDTAALPGGRGEARYLLPMGAIIMVNEGDVVRAGDVLARIPRETTKTKDITGGLPRVVELFEVRKPKECAVISEVDGVVSYGKQSKGKRKVIVDPGLSEEAQKEYLIPKGKHVTVHEGDFVRAGEPLMDGSINPHDILRSRSIKDLARYLVDEVQEVYRLQGVKIDDKHIEVIVRQMLQRVRITYPGDSDFLIGEQVERWRFEEENDAIEGKGGIPAQAEPLLLGITKASLSTDSFISAASFQETTKVLTEAAIAGKIDKLKGLKENIIMGRLIPAGTGIAKYRNVQIPEAQYSESIDISHQYSDEDVNDSILEEVGTNIIEEGMLSERDDLDGEAII